jgi:peptidoglycan/LPS O-acetylase OafA/YrhL
MKQALERPPELASALESALRLKHIPGLDAIRAVAVSMVVFMHFGYLPTATGELGVMMFFVLSGFLITRILLIEYRKNGTISLREFYRRTLRIFPTFYACWLLETLLITFHREPIRWWEPWVSFFYLNDYARAIAGPAMTQYMLVSWSLAVEEQFYLLWPAVLLWMLVSRKNTGRAVAFFILGVWLHRAILFVGFHVSYGYIYHAFDTRIDALMIGSLLAILTVEAATNPVTANALALPVKSPWLGIVSLAAIMLTVVFDPSIKKIPWLSMTSFSLQPVIIAVLLIQAVCFGNSQWRFLGHPRYMTA